MTTSRDEEIVVADGTDNGGPSTKATTTPGVEAPPKAKSTLRGVAAKGQQPTSSNNRKHQNNTTVDRDIGDKSAKDDDDDEEEEDVVDDTTKTQLRGTSVRTRGTVVQKGKTLDVNKLDRHSNHHPKGKRRKQEQPKNELTHLIPGYTAPLRLDAGSTGGGKSNSYITSSLTSLEDLKRRARQRESAAAVAVRHHPVSFKTGRPLVQQNSSSVATAGDKWFHMVPSVMTKDVQYDLAVIRNRNVLNPHRFYKSSDLASSSSKQNPMIQLGTVIEGSTEYYSSRLLQSQRRSNITDEVLADTQLSSYTKNKFRTMQQEKTKIAAASKTKKSKHTTTPYRSKQKRR